MLWEYGVAIVALGAAFMCGGASAEFRAEMSKEDGPIDNGNPNLYKVPDNKTDNPLAFLQDMQVTCGGCGDPMPQSEADACPGKTCSRYKKLNAGYTGNLHILGNRSTNPLPPVGE